jgi:tripartite-type tricarboxylate transporter receptor subunit TctC
MGGHVDFGVGSTTSYFALVLAGKVRTLAITGHTRLKALPGVPTFEESDISGDFVDSWAGSFVPAGTPQPIIDTLVDAATRVVQSPDFLTRIEKIGEVASSVSPAEFLAMIRHQQQTAATIAARVGMVQRGQ